MVSTHMPLARHDSILNVDPSASLVSTHMPLARHDNVFKLFSDAWFVSTHMPLARHDLTASPLAARNLCFYSHASCEA